MLGRKAQTSGAPAAALVLVIVSFILVFILLLPEEDRDELLGSGSGAASVKGDGKVIVLLDESPRTITRLREREFEHRISSFRIFTDEEDTILKSLDSLFIESNGVSNRSISVFAEKGTKNGRLAFAVNDFSGRLTIRLNGEQIFKGAVDSVLEPISLQLEAGENVLLFSVDSPPSWQFWGNNLYDIRGVRITGTIERTEGRESTESFFMGREEANSENIDDAYLSYWVGCGSRETGRVSVFLNNNLLSSKIPDCDNRQRSSIDPGHFEEGENELRFVAHEGHYLIDQAVVRTSLKEPIFRRYWFNLNESVFKKVSENKTDINLSLTFVDDGERKIGDIDVNGKRFSLDTRDYKYSRNIDFFVRRGDNSVRIVPERTLDVVGLLVEAD